MGLFILAETEGRISQPKVSEKVSPPKGQVVNHEKASENMKSFS